MAEFVAQVTFIVKADNLLEAREKVELLIEHGRGPYSDDIEWTWSPAVP